MSRFIYYYAECRYAESHYAECLYADCRYDECRYAECRYAECHKVLFGLKSPKKKSFITSTLEQVLR